MSGATAPSSVNTNKTTTTPQGGKASYNILQNFNAEQLQQQRPQVIIKTPQEKCNEMLTELSKLEKEVENFAGLKNDKSFLKLVELLTRCLLKLDEIDRGDEQINLNRKKFVFPGQLEWQFTNW